MLSSNLRGKFDEIMHCEQKLSGKDWQHHDVDTLHDIATQLNYIANLLFMARSYTRSYRLCKSTDVIPIDAEENVEENPAPETIAARISLVAEIATQAWDYRYGSETNQIYGITYKQFSTAARRHDIPEAKTGDSDDNGNRDEKAKVMIERHIQQEYSAYTNQKGRNNERKILQLLDEMEEKSTPLGRMLYLADKISAIIATLQSDKNGIFVIRNKKDKNLSPKDIEEMKICEYKVHSNSGIIIIEHDWCFASEMWTIDYLKIRKMRQYDDTGFFTALLVMYTLMTNKEWYEWREKDYLRD